MNSIKKYIAEFIGTMILVIFGCGTAMLVGCDAVMGGGYILTALAFGLVIVGMAYCVGNISGCHINPAVSLGVFMTGGMSLIDFLGYIVAQCLGALSGAGVLALIFKLGGVADKTGGFGSNGLAGVNGSWIAGLIVEIVLTFAFVLTILGVTSKKANHGSFGGLIIGLTLTLVHILGIGLTGTSVNPARSFGPALVAAITSNTAPIKSLWVFIVGPLVGAALAALLYTFLEKDKFSLGIQLPKRAPKAKKAKKEVVEEATEELAEETAEAVEEVAEETTEEATPEIDEALEAAVAESDEATAEAFWNRVDDQVAAKTETLVE